MAYLICLIYLLIGPVTPWWTSVLIAFLAGGFTHNLKRAGRAGAGGGLLIGLLLTTYFNFRGHNIVATRMGGLFGGVPPLIFLFSLALAYALVHAVASALGYVAIRPYTAKSSPDKTTHSI